MAQEEKAKDSDPIQFRIVEASQEDAPRIGQAVVMAIGDELAHELAGGRDVKEVITLFSALAARPDSQYSYLNALKAVDLQGKPLGFIVGYDGASLRHLRQAFIEEFAKRIGITIEGEIPDETDASEFYLDSLAVDPQYRGLGIAHSLIDAMALKAQNAGKPLGLLCDKTNSRARRLYESIGFRQIGERFFAGELMDHLQRSKSVSPK